MKQVLQVEDIRQEPVTRKKWSFKYVQPSTLPDGILITGPNSFVGAHIVSVLIEKWKGKIFLLVRAGNNTEAITKMQDAFHKWQLGSFDTAKTEIYLGDVCSHLMGLKPVDYNALQVQTGFVLHLAMNPMYNLPYAHFKRLWVPELLHMIFFCGDKKYPKSLHYPSSFNADFFTSDEDFARINTNAWLSGYAGFKWVANKTIENAFAQHLNGCLYDIPLVLGSVEKGLCPRQYSIWYILDMFLKAKCYIPFQFKILPVDVLSEVIVDNLLADQIDQGMRFIRPVLDEPVSDTYFGNMAATLLGLHETDQHSMREKCHNKERFDFVFPSDFYSLLEKVNKLPAVFLKNFDTASLPSTLMVFLSNLNRILSQKEELSTNK